MRRNHCWTLKEESFNFLIIIYQLLWISGLLKTHPIILIIKREYLFMICEIRAYKCYIPRMYKWLWSSQTPRCRNRSSTICEIHIPPGKKNFNVQLLPQDDHLESNRSVGNGSTALSRSSDNSTCREISIFRTEIHKEYFSHRLMQLLAIRTNPDERVVDIHPIITPLWLWLLS